MRKKQYGRQKKLPVVAYPPLGYSVELREVIYFLVVGPQGQPRTVTCGGGECSNYGSPGTHSLPQAVVSGR